MGKLPTILNSVAMVGFAVVGAKCRDIIREFVTEDRIAFVPARLTSDGEVKIPDRYFAWAKLEHVECIDYERCKVEWYPEDFEFRSLAGQVEHVWGLKIRPAAVAGLHLFRVQGRPVSIIDSKALLTAFHENDITGVLVTAEVRPPAYSRGSGYRDPAHDDPLPNAGVLNCKIFE